MERGGRVFRGRLEHLYADVWIGMALLTSGVNNVLRIECFVLGGGSCCVLQLFDKKADSTSYFVMTSRARPVWKQVWRLGAAKTLWDISDRYSTLTDTE